ncbi:MAG: carboxymethylenebutenolidase [Candidatus Poribacteria bacterium]|nr:MAG: carboxymethylenebutenolidase [Candidatus Poribacteria bacterium]
MREMLWIALGVLVVGAGSAPVVARGEEEHAILAQEVVYPSGEEQVTGYLAHPADGEGRLPAIIVIHEWWGLVPWVRENAERFARHGYVALAVDLYRGRSASDRDEAHELSRGLPRDRALRDLRAAFDYLTSRPDVNPERIGVIGWCMGGGYALDAAISIPELRAAVICYGRLTEDRSLLDNIRASVLGIFGGQDRGIPVEGVRRFEATLQELGKDVEVHVYPDAGHAFMNPNNQGGYREQDAADAWARIDTFFARTLQHGEG